MYADRDWSRAAYYIPSAGALRIRCNLYFWNIGETARRCVAILPKMALRPSLLLCGG